MLVLSRKVGERIQIGDNVTIVIARVNHQTVKIGIEAPSDCQIVRSELLKGRDPSAEPAVTLSV